MKKYDVIIIGAGPGGIFSAYEHGNVEILKKECGIDAETIEKKIIAAAMGL